MLIVFGSTALSDDIAGAALLGQDGGEYYTSSAAATAGGAATAGTGKQYHSATGTVAAGGVAIAAVGTATALSTPVTGWDVPVSTGLGNVRFPRPIAYGNEISMVIGPIRGLNTETTAETLWPGTSVQGWIAATRESNTPLGGTLKTFAVTAGTAKCVWFFTADEVDAALNAATTKTPDTTTFYAIVKGGDDFRRAIPLVYRAAILTA